MAEGDILDFISNNWSKLLGLGPNPGGMTDPMSGAAMNGPVPGAGTGAPFSPNSAPNGGTLNPAIANAPWIGSPGGGPRIGSTPAMTGPDGTPTVPAAGLPPPPMEENTGLLKPDIMPPQPPMGGGPMAGTPPPLPGGGPGAAAAAPGGISVPLPSARLAPLPGPVGGFAGPGGPPPGTAIPGPTGPTPPPGPPLPITPAAAAAAPPTQTAGDFLRALGIRRVSPGERAITAGLTGLGHGLSAVGAMRPGTNAAQAFATGAGGALSGGMKSLDDQKKELFNQSSTAFRDMILARSTDSTEMWRNAQAQALLARAKQQMISGGKGAMDTPEKRAAFIENETVRMHDQYRKLAESQAARAAKKDPDSADAVVDEEKLEKRTEDYRRAKYRQFGMDPDKGQELLERGMTPEKAYPTMSLQEFHNRVPKGAYYDTGEKYDKDGNFTWPNGTVTKGKPGGPVIGIRTTDPPGEAPAAAPAVPAVPAVPGSSALDDYYAQQAMNSEA